MNRENKRKKYEKHYYKNHACTDPFTCKVCGRLVVPEGAGSGHRNHCPNCLSSQHLDNEPGDREADCGGIMDPVAVWVRKMVSGPLSIDAVSAGNCHPTGWQRMITR